MSMYYRHGEAAALRDLGLEKTAGIGGFFRGQIPIVENGTHTVTSGAPQAAAAATEAAPGLLSRLGNTKGPLKVLGGIGALAGGYFLANKAMGQPNVEVHPTLPMRTMYS